MTPPPEFLDTYAGGMRHLVAVSDGSPATDACVRRALDRASAAGGAVVVVAVLPGSLIDRRLTPPEAGKRRREAENAARSAIANQLARVAPDVEADVVALFGDVVSDTLLLAQNLGADGVVMPGDHPDIERMIEHSPLEVLAVPPLG
jgi:nucleotide-binding universal stress UspA family protein